MKKLTFDEMKTLTGGRSRGAWDWEKLICNGYFIGMAALISSATIIGGIVVGALGAGVCELV